MRDQRALNDYRLRINHYVSAALRQVPPDIDSAMSWVQQYQDYLGLRPAKTVGTNMLLEASVGTAMQQLQGDLRVTAGYGLLGHVQTWAIIRLLVDLDAADAGEADEQAARLRILEQLDHAIG